MPIKVAIVEDDQSTNEYISMLLQRSQRLKYVASCRSAEMALKELPRQKPNVVLMDINLPRMSGVDCVRELKKILPDTKIVMLTGDDRDELVFESLKAGADGYLCKAASPGEIMKAVEEVHEGGAQMSGQIAAKVVEFFHRKGKSMNNTGRLTEREKEILALLSEGLMYKEIADKLGISYQTVNGHIKNIYEKLQVNSRSEAISKYLGDTSFKPRL